MADLNKKELQAVSSALGTLMALSRHSLSPTQTRMASRAAGNLLWVLGVNEMEAHGMTFVAEPPEGTTLEGGTSDLAGLLASPRSHQGASSMPSVAAAFKPTKSQKELLERAELNGNALAGIGTRRMSGGAIRRSAERLRDAGLLDSTWGLTEAGREVLVATTTKKGR